MIAFEVSVNGKLVARAGREDLGVLSAIVSAVGTLGPESGGTLTAPSENDLFLHVGGMTSKKGEALDEHLNWSDHRDLSVGDTVVVKVIESSEVDPPVKTAPPNKQKIEQNSREMFENAKQYYLENRHKYE
jgi:hypothetical protein